jgi:class 3 adenylate cyclase
MMRSIEENALLRMFVQSAVLERLRPLTQGPGALVGERTEATVVFLRIPEFASVVQQLPPDAVIQRLNENYQVIIPELTSRNGVVDRLMGESALVVFRGAEHLRRALDACSAARQQLRVMATRAGEQSPYTQGLGIGLDSGQVILGGLGGQDLGRLDYTMVGEAVDTAARLAALAASGEILIGERLHQKVRLEFDCQPAGERSRPVPCEAMGMHNVVGRRGGLA